MCRWHDARERLELSASIWHELGNTSGELHAARALGILHWKTGGLKEAEDCATFSLESARAANNRRAASYAHQLLALVNLHRGDIQAAEMALNSASEITPQDETRPSLLLAEFFGDLFMEKGQPSAALDRYEAAYRLALAVAPRGDIVAELRRRRAECLCLLGHAQEAYEEALAARESVLSLGDQYEECACYRVLAISAAAAGRGEEASRWFDQGLHHLADLGTPIEWGRLWLAFGDWLSQGAADLRSQESAAEAYRSAEELFARVGAEKRAGIARARLRDVQLATGGDDSATTASNPGVRFRRPRGAGELDRRCEMAFDQFRIVTRSRVFLDLLGQVARLAESHTPILLLGESGTGKELVANGIHKLSGRTGRYVAINCGALPRDMVESELFGHLAGAFTGATRDKTGLLEACDKGTAFLDEIGDMALDLQTKLLRFLESGEVRQVGSNKKTTVDTLVVAATNRDRSALEKGDGFRTDLYYRLAHAVVVLPPLRRRGDDIDILAAHFLETFCREYGKTVTLSGAARNRLAAYSWPGNVRQLRAAIRRVVILAAPNEIVPPEALDLGDAEAPATLTQELEQAERRKIVEALGQARGVRTDAARLLGMSRTTMLGKMKRYGIH
jgi:transcriptional regulator with AAA-type ATPase domain/tetratricopeptide (TPR) repeat protein